MDSLTITHTESYEAAFPRVVEAVAQGETRSATNAWLECNYKWLVQHERTLLLNDALNDALACGVEREDIDSSWF